MVCFEAFVSQERLSMADKCLAVRSTSGLVFKRVVARRG